MSEPSEIVERAARALCEADIRYKRRHDALPEELEPRIPAAVDYHWRDYVPQVTTVIAAMREPIIAALKPFADCAAELDGSDDVPRAPDGEWAKFRLLTDDYRRARDTVAMIATALGSPPCGS
jgi:hypothetical protein